MGFNGISLVLEFVSYPIKYDDNQIHDDSVKIGGN
jgi:hypothetical protein